MRQATVQKKSDVEYKLTMVVPFMDGWEFTSKCLEKLAAFSTVPTQLILIDNGSDKSYYNQAEEIVRSSHLHLEYVGNSKNVGVLKTFKQGLDYSKSPITCFIHSDVLIQEVGYDQRIVDAFEADPQLGLAGLFGARGVHPDGGREGSMSHMLGQEWGTCACHRPAAMHHGELMMTNYPCVVFDGVGLFFRTQVLKDLADFSDTFADWRSPHHFYDRIMSLKVLERGYHMQVIGIKFDHYSGATVNHSQKYVEFGRQWLKDHDVPENSVGIDDTIYWLAEKQWREEYAHRLPVRVDQAWNVRWTA